MKRLLSVILATSLAVSAPLALAKGDKHRSVMSQFKGLNLSVEQKQTLKTIAQDAKAEKSIYKQEIENIRDDYKSLMNLEAWDAAQATVLITTRVEQAKQLKLISAKTRHAMLAVLNDEQKEALQAKKEKRSDSKKAKKKKFAKALRRLDLDETQTAAVTELMQNAKATREANKEAFAAYASAQKELMQAAVFDQSAWSALYTEASDLIIQNELAKTKFKFDLKNILNDKQQKKLRKLMSKKGNKAGKAKNSVKIQKNKK